MIGEVDKVILEFKEQESKFKTLNPKLSVLEKHKGSPKLQEERKESELLQPEPKFNDDRERVAKMMKEVKVQLQGTRDDLTKNQELLRNEITDLEFERIVKLQEQELQRAHAHYKEYIVLLVRRGRICAVGALIMVILLILPYLAGMPTNPNTYQTYMYQLPLILAFLVLGIIGMLSIL